MWDRQVTLSTATEREVLALRKRERPSRGYLAGHHLLDQSRTVGESYE